MIASQGKAQGLYNTMVDFYGVVMDKVKEEMALDKPPFESFLFEHQVNRTALQRTVNQAVELHDQILVRSWSRSILGKNKMTFDLYR